MKHKHVIYNFSAEKNAYLKTTHGVSFDEVVSAINNGQIIDIIKHPNEKKYPTQELMIISLKGYIYIVPFVEQDNGDFFLKTIYPSRKATKYYLSGGISDEK